MSKPVGPPKMWPLQTEAAKYLYERMRQAKEFGLAPDLELWQNALRDVEIEAARQAVGVLDEAVRKR